MHRSRARDAKQDGAVRYQLQNKTKKIIVSAIKTKESRKTSNKNCEDVEMS
jgi:hypothetical protein